MGINGDKRQRSDAAKLRRQAEEKLCAELAESQTPLTEHDLQRLVHELQVHQLELEMQNAELRQSRNETEELLEKYTDLYDFAPVGYLTLDRNGIVRAANLFVARLLGIERNLLLERQFTKYITRDARSVFTEFLQQAFLSRAKISCELTLLQEGLNPSSVQIEGLVDSAGQVCRVAVIDITERSQLEEKLEILHTELAARAVELETRNLDLEAFNYTVSHDLRSPLTVINSYCQVIKEVYGNSLDEDCLGYIQEMYAGTLHMSQLIDALLDFSRLDRIELQTVKVDLSAMAENVAKVLRLLAPKRQVTFLIAKGVVVDGDSVLLPVVLDNLMGNSMKYTGNLEEAIIEFGVTELAGATAYFIRDNGPGFAKSQAENLFKPFARAHDSAEFAGHGIGLATVERIIKRHGGRVWAESEPGRGATFLFILGQPVVACPVKQ